MFFNQLLTNFLLFSIGILGFIFSKRSILILLMCIEIVLLSVNLNFLILSIYLDDVVGQVFSILILTVAASESSIGLSLIIMYYRVRGHLLINNTSSVKG